jgi:hypothetical protein
MTSHAWFWEWDAGGSRAWYFWNEQDGGRGYTLAGLFPRDAESLRSLANQAGDARMWAGIHFRSDVEAGRAIGDAVAALAIPLGLVVPVR